MPTRSLLGCSWARIQLRKATGGRGSVLGSPSPQFFVYNKLFLWVKFKREESWERDFINLPVNFAVGCRKYHEVFYCSSSVAPQVFPAHWTHWKIIYSTGSTCSLQNKPPYPDTQEVIQYVCIGVASSHCFRCAHVEFTFVVTGVGVLHWHNICGTGIIFAALFGFPEVGNWYCLALLQVFIGWRSHQQKH